MSRGVPYGVRLALPERWYELGRDDPDAFLATLVTQLLPHGPEEPQDRLAADLFHAYGLVDLVQPLDALVHVPQPEEGVRAVLLTHPVTERPLLRRDLAARADRVERGLRRSGAASVERATRATASGPAVRLRAVLQDEVGTPVEQVVHLVRPEGLPVAVAVRVQWRAGRADREELAAAADRIAADALVEVLA